MRVTSKMMTTNMLSNINKNKLNVSDKADQYSTQQKIQRPSQDPVVAVRSLKFRTMSTEISQYVDKNIPDALSWMEQTESALDSVSSVLTTMNEYFNNGANDTLETTDRDALADTLTQYKEQIYQCLNADDAGRYLFTGYRTDTSYLYEADDSSRQYSITENLSASSLNSFTYVTGGASYTAGNTASDYVTAAAVKKTGYKMTLSYDDLDSVDSISYTIGTTTTALKVGTIDANDENAYDVDAYNAKNGTTYEALAIKGTGEVIVTSDIYDKMSKADSINTSYKKTNFDKGDVRPEHNFDCTSTELDASGNAVAGTTKTYTKPTEQNIEYEVNFSQKITVNTMGNQVMDASLINQIDDVINQISKVQEVENKLSDIESMISTGNYTGSADDMEALKEQVTNELTLQKSVLQEKFGNGLTTIKNVQASVTKENADLGSRYQRLELTQARLEDQQTNVSEMITKNDTVDIEDAVINYTSAITAYNASLNAASKVVQNSLLDFL